MLKLENCVCPVCDYDKFKFKTTIVDQVTNISGKFNLVQCSECNLVYLNPRPKLECINLLYPDNYEPFKKKLTNSKIRKKIFFDFKEIFHERGSGKKLLEIGCANGNYLKLMKSLGWECHGLELSKAAADSVRNNGFVVYNNTLEEAKFNSKYDIITAWMVFEHLFDLKKSLTKLKSISKPETILIFSVPNINCISFKIFKSYWHNIHGPAHLQHFDSSTIKILLEKTGWEIQKIEYHRKYSDFFLSLSNFLKNNNQLKLSKMIRRFSNWKLQKIIFYIPAIITTKLFKSSRMTVYAKVSNN